MTKYELTKEFIEVLEIKKYKCQMKYKRNSKNCQDYQENHLCIKCGKYPTLTAEKILELEGLILKIGQKLEYRLWGDPEDLVEKIQAITFGKYSNWSNNRPEALQRLIIELINAEVLDKEEVKGIVENDNKRDN